MSDKTESKGGEKSVVPPPDDYPEEDRMSSEPVLSQRARFLPPFPTLPDATVTISSEQASILPKATTLEQAKIPPTVGSTKGHAGQHLKLAPLC